MLFSDTMTDILKSAHIVKDRVEIKLRAAEAVVADSVFESPELCIPGHELHAGKVHDEYIGSNDVVLVNTDRLETVHDKVIDVPFKGAISNSISMYWFRVTKDIVPNHCLSMPHPNILVAKQCTMFPVTFLVHGFLTDEDHSSMWSQYTSEYSSNRMQKYQKLSMPHIVTYDADGPIAKEEAAAKHGMTTEEFEKCALYAMRLYEFGYNHTKEKRLLLVSATYKFGKDENGTIMVVGDLHSPESTHYWLEETYHQCLEENKEPDTLDFEYLMEWLRQRDSGPHVVSPYIIEETAIRILSLHEMITDEELRLETISHERSAMERAVTRALVPIH